MKSPAPLAIELFAGTGSGTEGHFVAYLVTCIPTRSLYVGITTQGIHKRWNNHVNGALSGRQKTPLHRDIARLGVEYFTIKPILSAFSLEDLLISEVSLIDQWKSMAPDGYNLAHGGGVMSYTRTPESIERSAAKHRGVPRDPAASERAAQKIRGTTRSAETRAKMAEVGRNRIFSPETRRKIAAFRTGKSTNAGEINGQSKLTADQVRQIKYRLADGESQRSIARSFPIVHVNTIWKIANGRKWKSVA
jgi:group I intron endonuclease